MKKRALSGLLKLDGPLLSILSLLIAIVISGVIMYLVMFVMIDRLSSFYNNLNMLYMTLMMVAPMAVLMLVLMREMYPNNRLNLAIGLASVIIFAGSFYAMRTQAAKDIIQ